MQFLWYFEWLWLRVNPDFVGALGEILDWRHWNTGNTKMDSNYLKQQQHFFIYTNNKFDKQPVPNYFLNI